MRFLLPLFIFALLAVPADAVAKSGAYAAGRIVGFLLIFALLVAIGLWIARKIAR
jgi:hypothetical protein